VFQFIAKASVQFLWLCFSLAWLWSFCFKVYNQQVEISNYIYVDKITWTGGLLLAYVLTEKKENEISKTEEIMGKFKYRHQKKTKNKFGWSMDMWAINNRCIAVS
jgi:hypothetical protein